MRSVISLAVLALLIAGCSTVAEPEPDPAPEPVTDQPPERTESQDPPKEDVTRTRTLDLDIPAETTSAELWYRIDGDKWVNHARVSSADSVVRFLAPRDGVYEFEFVALNEEGERRYTPDRDTKADRRIVVDSSSPVVEVLEPNGGEVFGAGRTTRIRWSATEGDTVDIEVSSNNGQTWAPVIRNIRNTGEYFWDIPKTTSETFLLRVTVKDPAGNPGSDRSDGPFAIDGLAPEVRITGPTRANSIPVPIDFTAADLGGGGMHKVQLFVTRDGGKRWELHSETMDMDEPIQFRGLDGTYGLLAVGVDTLGNASRIPARGTKPDFVLQLDRTKPQVRLFEPKKGVAGYARHELPITWVAKDNVKMADNGITIQVSDDGGKSWRTIEENVLNTGRYSKWKPPALPGDQYRIRVVARDLMGNLSSSTSENFTVDAAPPVGLITATSQSGTALKVEYAKARGTSFSKVDRAELWFTPLENNPDQLWYPYGRDEDVDGTMWFRQKDGRYGLSIVVSTEAARTLKIAQKPPKAGDAAQKEVELDFQNPQLALTSLKGDVAVAVGMEVRIGWTYADANRVANGVRLSWSGDGGRTWKVIAENVASTRGPQTNIGEYLWFIDVQEAGTYLVKIEGRDKFNNWSQDLSDPFKIDARPPSVRVTQLPPRYVNRRRIQVPYEATDDVSQVVEVVAYISDSNKEAWQAAKRSDKARGIFVLEFPKDGEYDVALIAKDKSGQRSGDTLKGLRPHFKIGIDTEKPEVGIRQWPGKDSKRYYLQDYKIVWSVEDNLKSAIEKMKIRVSYQVGRDTKWHVAADGILNAGSYMMKPFLQPGRQIRIRVTATDAAGNSASRETPRFLPEDLPRPKIWIEGVLSGQQFTVGSSPLLFWRSSDPGIQQATLRIAKAGQTSKTAASITRRGQKVTLPTVPGDYHLQVVASDSLGNPIESPVVMIVVKKISSMNFRVVTQFIDGSILGPASNHRIIWQPKDATVVAKKAVLQYLIDGKWKDIQPVTGPDAILSTPKAPGNYAVRMKLFFKDGEEVASNAVKFQVSVKARPPFLELSTFRGGNYYAAASGRMIGLRHENVDLTQVILEVSADAGKTWTRVAPSLLMPVEDGIHWKMLPKEKGDKYKIRLTFRLGERVVTTESDRTFSIDDAAPWARVTGPAKGDAPVRLDVEKKPSLAPIETLVLYYTEDGGQTWQSTERTFASHDAVIFRPERKGVYGVYVTARSMAGLAMRPPQAGTKPQHMIEVGVSDSPTPDGKVGILLEPDERIVKGGTALKITWNVEKPPKNAKVLLQLVVEGTPTHKIIETPDMRGSFDFKLPRLDSGHVRVQAKLLVEERVADSSTSRRFGIDSSPPTVKKVKLDD